MAPGSFPFSATASADEANSASIMVDTLRFQGVDVGGSLGGLELEG
jgi:hypothetical protein